MRSVDFGDPGALALAGRLVRAEAVVILPTETLYGFSALASSDAARQRIEAWKGIGAPRSFLALVADFDSMVPFLHPGQDRRGLGFLRRNWPGPLTAVLQVERALGWGETVESGATAAFRIPAHPRLRQLLATIGAPIVSTSVNRSGSPPLQNEVEIRAEFGAADDLWFFRDRGLETRAPGRGSSVVDLRNWPPRLLRAGAFDLDAALAEWVAHDDDGTPHHRRSG